MSNRSLNEITESNEEQNNDESNEKVITNLDELKSRLTAAKPNEYIYWRFKCVSKNGMFVNSRYVVAPKSILFAAVEVGNDSDDKPMTFRFPNTAIKIHFHSNMTQVCSEYRQEKERNQHQMQQQQQQQQKQPIVATTVVPKTPNNTNKIAQILLKKQIEQLGGVAVAVGGEQFEPHLSRGYNNTQFLF